ncbi:MAG TPA: hypothetical protein PKE30_10500, partial [Niabella sp.]|nr:hypothetical protein [Niabella sp.]
NAKTVSVETTHFSDWVVGKFIEMAITPASRSVKVKESLQLSVTGCGFWGKDDADLIPFIPVNESLDRLAAWKGNFAIDNSWTLNGTKAPVSNVSGSLQPGADGSAATYTAPDNVPSQNPVAIAVSLTQKQSNGPTGRFMLVSNIRVYDEYFARVTVQGVTTEFSGTEIFTGVPGVVPSGGNVASAIMLGDGTLSLMFQHVTRNLIVALSCKNPAKGSISFITRDHATGAGVQYNKLSSNTPLTTYSSSSSQLINANGKCGYSGAPSSGSLALTEYKNEKGVIVMGSFSGTIWNVGNVPGCANSSTPISGEFAMPLFK